MIVKAVIEAIDSNKIVPTSMANTWKMFDNLHMMWMCIWMCPNHTMVALIDRVFGSDSEFLVISRQQMIVTVVMEALDPINILPTSMSNTYKVFDNLHMMRMCTWMCPNHTMAALIVQVFGSDSEIWVSPPQQMIVAVVIEAIDPINILPTSMSNTYKVFDNLHMMWMCI